MKLLERLKRIVNELGSLKRTWFTSFNMSPSFVEGYILPVILGLEERPRTVRDFEDIQRMANDVDIRFFCDGRVFHFDDVKKTAVPFHTVNMSRFDQRLREGVFHPKVILLQDEEDNTVLITGSANLTVGGWAHNRECVVIKTVSDKWNADALFRFFKTIFQTIEEDFPVDFRIRWESEKADWTFLSSLTGERSFIDQLLQEDPEEIIVFSPFFPNDLERFLRIRLKGARVAIAPDTIKDGDGRDMIRLLNTESNRKAFESDSVSIFSYPYSDGSQDRMDHSKVWLTPKKLAIGSWNMTEAGVGASESDANNIEAGVLEDVSSSDLFRSVINKFSRWEREPGLVSAERLEDEKPDLTINRQAYHVKAALDWSRQRYFITVSGDGCKNDLMIKLPGVSGETPLTGGCQPLCPDKISEALRDHYFFILKKNELVQTGVITEVNTAERPVLTYSNLEEIFYSFLAGEQEASSEEKQRPAYTRGDEPEEEAPGQINDAKPSLSYFTMFRAFKIMNEKLDSAIKVFEQDSTPLLRFLMGCPGSLFETAGKIKKLLTVDPARNSFSNVFTWFMAHEVNRLLLKARKELLASQDFKDDLVIKRIKNHLQTPPDIPAMEGHEKYLTYIMEKCEYNDDGKREQGVQGVHDSA